MSLLWDVGHARRKFDEALKALPDSRKGEKGSKQIRNKVDIKNYVIPHFYKNVLKNTTSNLETTEKVHFIRKRSPSPTIYR